MENQRELTVLLIEDDQFACEEIRNYIDQLDDMHLLGITETLIKPLIWFNIVFRMRLF